MSEYIRDEDIPELLEEAVSKPLPLPLPSEQERRNVVRNRDSLIPENGRRMTASVPTPEYEESGALAFYDAVPEFVTDEGAVFALSMQLIDPIGTGIICPLIDVGSGSGEGNVFVFLTSSDEVYFVLQNQSIGAATEIVVPFGALGLSPNKSVRLAFGIRLHDPHRTICLWADGRLIATAGKGTFVSTPASWGGDQDLQLVNGLGIRIVSHQFAYYRGAPAPRGSNR